MTFETWAAAFNSEFARDLLHASPLIVGIGVLFAAAVPLAKWINYHLF